ncbi:MAG: hypothetical protein C0605_08050 [Hyphomicrobiales bacterium]|nr:MAG: hypothetical protein C0605_08050 [Hyphomicrobiales bacterium]
MSMFNFDLPQYALFAVALIFVLGLIFLLTWILRRFSGLGDGQPAFSRREKRLRVIEGASLGNRHRLVLIQRDQEEHLLLIGGATDLVIERNISRLAAAPATPPARPAPSQHIEPRFSAPASSEADEGQDFEDQPEPDLRPGPRPGEA